MNDKKRVLLSILTAFCLASMFLDWLGVVGINELRGIDICPMALPAFLLIYIGIWFKDGDLLFAILGSILLLIAEIIAFLTWHIGTITGRLDIGFSIDFSLPGFYAALSLTLLMFILFSVTKYRQKLKWKTGCH